MKSWKALISIPQALTHCWHGISIGHVGAGHCLSSLAPQHRMTECSWHSRTLDTKPLIARAGLRRFSPMNSTASRSGCTVCASPNSIPKSIAKKHRKPMQSHRRAHCQPGKAEQEARGKRAGTGESQTSRIQPGIHILMLARLCT